MSRTTRYIAEAAVCAGLGAAFLIGCTIAADDSKPSEFGTTTTAPLPTTQPREVSLLTPEQIDVLTEGEDGDHPWEQCTIAGSLVTCPDGFTTTYAMPEDDGSLYAPGSFASQAHLTPCKGVDREPHLPCRVLMRPTYVVGGDGIRHEHCYITLVTREDSQMVCADDTVWAS